MNLTIFVKSILAGLAIALAATTYLSVDNSIVGGLLFSIGLISIYVFDWYLYTGKCCYLFDNFKKNSILLIFVLIGNFIGVFLTGFILRFSGLTSIIDKAIINVDYKLEHNFIEYFILAIFCGISMSIAVLGYSKQKDSFGRFIIILLPITLFIVAKFEHVVANMFYITIANMWSLDTLVFIFICAIGNLVGCSIIPLCNKLIKCEK